MSYASGNSHETVIGSDVFISEINPEPQFLTPNDGQRHVAFNVNIHLLKHPKKKIRAKLGECY